MIDRSFPAWKSAIRQRGNDPVKWSPVDFLEVIRHQIHKGLQLASIVGPISASDIASFSADRNWHRFEWFERLWLAQFECKILE
jgi:hypothetical protein